MFCQLTRKHIHKILSNPLHSHLHQVPRHCLFLNQCTSVAGNSIKYEFVTVFSLPWQFLAPWPQSRRDLQWLHPYKKKNLSNKYVNQPIFIHNLAELNLRYEPKNTVLSLISLVLTLQNLKHQEMNMYKTGCFLDRMIVFSLSVLSVLQLRKISPFLHFQHIFDSIDRVHLIRWR